MADEPITIDLLDCVHYVVNGGWLYVPEPRFWMLFSCGFYAQAPTPEECRKLADEHAGVSRKGVDRED